MFQRNHLEIAFQVNIFKACRLSYASMYNFVETGVHEEIPCLCCSYYSYRFAVAVNRTRDI